MAPRKGDASETEMEVLKALWEHGAGTVREVDEHLRRDGRQWAYTTLQTLLNRLEAKGLVSIDKRTTPHVFRAAVTRDKLLGQRLKDLTRDLCGGAMAPLVRALVTEHRFTPEEIQHFRKLLDDLED